jgi:acyl-CoA synthetase (NDP forming)
VHAGIDRLRELSLTAAAEGRTHLTEAEGFELCEHLGLATPKRAYLDPTDAGDAVDLEQFGGDRVVVKVVDAALAHKSDIGGVEICGRSRGELERTVTALRSRCGDRPVTLCVYEFVPHETRLGGELLLSVCSTREFGPVVTLGLGGLDAERLTAWEPLFCVASGSAAKRLEETLATQPLLELLTARFRGQPPLVETGILSSVLGTVSDFAAASMPPLAELEINPLVVAAGRPVALDVLGRLAPDSPQPRAPRPLDKLERLLRPASIAVAGVSRRRNPGRIILDNIRRAGFPTEGLWVVKPGVEEIDGCRAVPSVDELPDRVDLLVLAISADEVPAVVERVVEGRLAESIILIPGGLGESRGSRQRAQRVEDSLARSRKTEWRGPLVNGGNCLGIKSSPGRYDTLFIPGHKLRFAREPETPLALVSQSGAFAVARSSKLATLSPRYVVSVGNQIDLTVADYLTWLADDEQVRVVACYVEGFRRGDGARFLAAVERLAAAGRPVVLYRAGRTTAGAEAAASHTASLAGAYRLTRQLAARAGALVADSLEEFEDLTATACLLDGRSVAGRRLGAVSNAGFESVAIADRLGGFELPRFSARCRERLREMLAGHRLESIVSLRNPLDVTPIVDDASFAEAAAAILEDPAVEVGIVGCVPLTPALATLPASPEHSEDVASTESVAGRLIELWGRTEKAWAAVVDAGSRYDSCAEMMAGAGVPTFRTVDRAMRAIDAYCGWRLAHRPE